MENKKAFPITRNGLWNRQTSLLAPAPEERGDTEGAKALLLEHIGTVERSLEIRPSEAPDAGDRLRATLAPLFGG